MHHLVNILKRKISCLVLHPIAHQLANGPPVQAVGLVTSLGWTAQTTNLNIERQVKNQWSDRSERQQISEDSRMKLRKISFQFFFSKGKMDEVVDIFTRSQADILFINCQLSSTQLNNLRQVLNTRVSRDVRVYDRFLIILHIFSVRAKSALTQKQVQLCVLGYLKTQLIRTGTTYSSVRSLLNSSLQNFKVQNLQVVSARGRNVHGVLGGQGQTQLQLQRRLIKDKQVKLRREIAAIASKRQLRPQSKLTSASLPRIAILGYTNAGKSALLNLLAKHQEVSSKDNLFETLSITARRVSLPSGFNMVLLDTVGFIAALPHQLIQAFKSTLQQAVEADVLLVLIDGSQPTRLEQRQVVFKTLRQTKGYDESRVIQVWNKIDLVQGLEVPEGVFSVSVKLKTNIPALCAKIESVSAAVMGKKYRELHYCITKHEVRKTWLLRFGNCQLLNQNVYPPSSRFPHGSVSFGVWVDDAIWGKYVTATEGREKRPARGMPPSDWLTKQ